MAEPAEVLDWGYKLGEILTFVAGVVGLIWKLGRDTSNLRGDMKSQAEKLEITLQQQNVVVGELKDDIKTLNKLITEVAVQTQRLDHMTERMNRQDKLIDELRHEQG